MSRNRHATPAGMTKPLRGKKDNMQAYQIYFGIDKDCEGHELATPAVNKAVTNIQTRAVDVFDGFSQFIGWGGYRNQKGHVVLETCCQLHIFVGDTQTGRDIFAFCQFVRTSLNQESVCLVHPDGEVQFITAEEQTS